MGLSDRLSTVPDHDGRQQRDNAHMPDDDAQFENSKAAIIKALCEHALPAVEEARQRGFVFFDCELNITVRSLPIRLRFGDGKGAFYERALGIKKVALQHGITPNLGEAVDINAAVRNYVRHLEGVRMLGNGMTRRRVPAKPEN
jgi:hypothetical protein